MNQVATIERSTFAGFSVMALDCLLIETLQQFYDGTPGTEGTSKAAFCRFLLQSSFGQFFDRQTAAKFYTFIRNGIIHQAEIKGSSRIMIRDDVPLVMNTPDGNGLIINRRQFHQQLVYEFESYVEHLRKNDPPDITLRNKFKNKMDAICDIASVKVTWQPFSIGILAYGSLIDDPGTELDPHITQRRKTIGRENRPITTPFCVEYARTSRARDGAPTLVPVKQGGVQVKAALLVMDEEIPLAEVMDMLYRREIHRVGDSTRRYTPPDLTKKNAVRIEQLLNKFGMDVVLYTSLPANIDEDQLTPEHLAQLAMQSAKSEAGQKRKDGISYLLGAMNNEIETPLTDAYKQAILDKTGTDSLEAAWKKLTGRE